MIEKKPYKASSSLTESVERLRITDSYGIEWGNLLKDDDTDPQMLRDVVAVVRAYLQQDENITKAIETILDGWDDWDAEAQQAAQMEQNPDVWRFLMMGSLRSAIER